MDADAQEPAASLVCHITHSVPGLRDMRLRLSCQAHCQVPRSLLGAVARRKHNRR